MNMTKKSCEAHLMAGCVSFILFFVTTSLASGSFDGRKDIVRVSNLHQLSNQIAVEPLTVTQVVNATFSVDQHPENANKTTTPTTKMKTKTSKREKKKVASLKIKPPIQAQEEPLISSSSNTISRNSLSIDVNSTEVEYSSAPYSSLPESYKNVQPTSYYATHTHVEPIKDYFDHKFIIEESSRNSEAPRKVTNNATDSKQPSLDSIFREDFDNLTTNFSDYSAEFFDSNEDDFFGDGITRKEDVKNGLVGFDSGKNVSDTGSEEQIHAFGTPFRLKPSEYEDSLPEEFNPTESKYFPPKPLLSTTQQPPQIYHALETMYQIHPRPEPFGPSGIRPELPPSPPSGLHDAGPDPVPEYETNFVPSRQAPHYVQQFQHLHPKLTKVQRHVHQDKPPAGGQPVRQDPQQPRFYTSASSFGVSVTPIVVNQEGFKEGNVFEEGPGRAPAPSYANQWTSSGEKKKPLKDPSKEAAKYWQRAKEPPKGDQSAVGSSPDFLEWDQGYQGRPDLYQTYPVDPHPFYYDDPDDGPERNALLYLTPKGPKIPVLSKFAGDLFGLFGSLGGAFRGPVEDLRESAKASGEPMLERLGQTMAKIMGGHFGDGSFDGFDFLPLVAIIVGASLLLAALFPAGLTSLGINSGATVVLGRKGTRKEEEKSLLDDTIHQLERGIMMISALRNQDGCALRLACRLGDLANESPMLAELDNKEMILNTIHRILPEKFTRFSRSFEGVMSKSDLSSCQAECNKCVDI